MDTSVGGSVIRPLEVDGARMSTKYEPEIAQV